MAAPHFKSLVGLIYKLALIATLLGVSGLNSASTNLTNRTQRSPELEVNELYSNSTGGLATIEPLAATTIDNRTVISSSGIVLDNSKRPIGMLQDSLSQAETLISNLDFPLNPTKPSSTKIFIEVNHEKQHHSNSRLLVMILFLGLFGVLILTLLSIYAVRFCVCGRRKHMMQRNLINDLPLDLPCTCINMDNCQRNMYSAEHVVSGELPSWLLHEHNQTLLNSPSEQWPHISEALEQQTLFTEYAEQVGASTGNRPQQYMNRPPSYYELFGSQNAHTSLSLNLDVAASTSTGINAEPLTTTSLDTDNSLLIKLNLNKTKVLSPENLIILSNLLDVPIMIQKECTFLEE